jgi:hypothetical protein
MLRCKYRSISMNITSSLTCLADREAERLAISQNTTLIIQIRLNGLEKLLKS